MADGSSLLQLVATDIYHGRFTPAATITAVILATALLLLPLLNKFLAPNRDPREPPFIEPSIPFIGHIIGILRHQNNYHRIMQHVSLILSSYQSLTPTAKRTPPYP